MSDAGGRKTTEVAVGVLLRPDRTVLLADRPAGKPYPGYWEFPGGKIEPGESVEHALTRELHEELGIDIGAAQPWVTFEFAYPHAYVRLHFCRVYAWHGVPHGREGQRFGFFRPDGPLPKPLLPAAVPALRWLGLPDVCAFARTASQGADGLLAAIDRLLARGVRLLIVDGPVQALMLSDILARAHAHDAHVIAREAAPGVQGRLLSADELDAVARSTPADWLAVGVASRDDLARAARHGCDLALVGPVLPVEGRGGVTTIGWHGAAELLRAAPLPVILFGGLRPADLALARAAGAHGIAVEPD